jgi:uncharacterized protein
MAKLPSARGTIKRGIMLDLVDYRRRVFEMYRQIRELGAEGHELFRRERDKLFAEHPQSALDEQQKLSFKGLAYYDYNPAYRVLTKLEDAEPKEYLLDAGDDGKVKVSQIGKVSFDLPKGSGSLGVYWIGGYGGGVFIPFRDASNQLTTYGGGRYLYDTIKGADLGINGDNLLLDFNFAYHPSCSYNSRWVCPLAPQDNRLNFPIEAGERLLF